MDIRRIITVLFIAILLGTVFQLFRSREFSNITQEGNVVEAFGGKPVHTLSSDVISRLKREKYVLVYEKDSQESKVISQNIKKTLEYLQKDCDLVEAGELDAIQENYNAVIVSVEHLDAVSNMEVLLEYAFAGGKVWIAERPELDATFYKVFQKLGIYEVYPTTNTEGIELFDNVLVKGTGIRIDTPYIVNNALQVHLKEDCTIYARSAAGIPLLWKVPYEKGTFMMFNGTMLYQRNNRGMIAGALGILEEDFIYPVMNAKMVFIDDFPSPFPHGYNEKIINKYHRDVPRFYREVWWPEILKTSAKYDIKYTGMLIYSYNHRIKPPFEDKDSLSISDFILYGKELIKNGGELGIHGYNHFSLTLDGEKVSDFGYSPWNSVSDMEQALVLTREYIQQVFPRYEIKTYVPPSNTFSGEGREAVKKALPAVKTIASLHEEDMKNIAYVQEFEKASDGLLEMPRLTSGYSDSKNNIWVTMNGVTAYGLFNHFIHPDDLLDPERSHDNNWDELLRQYIRFLQFVHGRYSWLRSMTASQGTEVIENYLTSQTWIEKNGDSIVGYNDHFEQELSFLLRTSKSIKSKENCSIEKIDDEIFLIKTESPMFRVVLGE